MIWQNYFPWLCTQMQTCCVCNIVLWFICTSILTSRELLMLWCINDTQQEIFIKVIITFPTTSQARRCTTLWNNLAYYWNLRVIRPLAAAVSRRTVREPYATVRFGQPHRKNGKPPPGGAVLTLAAYGSCRLQRSLVLNQPPKHPNSS